MKKIILAIFICLIVNFSPTSNANADISEKEVTYLALAIHTVDPIRSMTFVAKGKNIRLTKLKKGINFFVLEAESKEYCLQRFRVYDLKVKMRGNGMCFYVEEGELNYPGHFVIRNPVTSLVPNHFDFEYLLNKNNAAICKKYLKNGCGS